jgi:hypothetical protein
VTGQSEDRVAANVREARVGTTVEERAELREAMAILHRVKARIVCLSVAGCHLPTEARLLDEALDKIGAVVKPGSVRHA